MASDCHISRYSEGGSSLSHHTTPHELAEKNLGDSSPGCRRRYRKYAGDDNRRQHNMRQRIQQYYKCDLKDHIRADCCLPPVKDKEKEVEKRIGAPLPVEVEERKSEVTKQTKTNANLE